HLDFEPVVHLLVGGSFGIGVAGNAQSADEQRRVVDDAVGSMDRDGGAGPIYEQFFGGPVLLAQNYVLLLFPVAVELAESAVGIAVGILLAILLPQQLKRQIPVLFSLLAKSGEIRQG